MLAHLAFGRASWFAAFLGLRFKVGYSGSIPKIMKPPMGRRGSVSVERFAGCREAGSQSLADAVIG